MTDQSHTTMSLQREQGQARFKQNNGQRRQIELWCKENQWWTSPVTIVTSVPWERNWDIKEKFSVMGTLSLQTFLKSYWLMPVQMTCQLLRSMQIMTSSRQYKCGAPRDNYIRIWYRSPLSWTSSAHIPALREPEVMIVTGDIPLSSFKETSWRNSPLWERYSIPPWERLQAACTSNTPARYNAHCSGSQLIGGDKPISV